MTRAVLGIIGGSGLYDLPGLEKVREERIESPWGEPSAPLRDRRDRRAAHRVHVAPRQGPQALAVRHQLPRQYRRDEAGRGHRPRSRSRPAARSRKSCRRAPSCWSTNSSTAPSAAPAPSSAKAAWHMCRMAHPVSPRLAPASCRSRGGRRHPDGAERDLCVHGGAAILHARREHDLQEPRLLGDRHDQHARSQARPRGGDLLRDRRHGHRFRLLASGPRRRHRHRHHQGADGQCREGARSLRGRLARDFPREHEPCPIGSDSALDTAIITAPEARDPELLAKLDAVAGRVLKGA